MKALTITQPYASLIALGHKTIETRSWRTPHLGPIAIHAGKGLGPVGGMSGLWRFYYEDHHIGMHPYELPRGAIVAVAELVECCQFSVGFTPPEGEENFGDFAPGRYGWWLAKVKALPEPVEIGGKLGVWTLPDDVSSRVMEQLLATTEGWGL